MNVYPFIAVENAGKRNDARACAFLRGPAPRSLPTSPGRDRLPGTVEVDETFIGGEEAGLRGGRANARKSLLGVAVEVRQPRGYGRCRMEILPGASAGSLHPFLTRHVEPGATVITDGWMGYHGITRLGYAHVRRSQRPPAPAGRTPASCCPGCIGSPP